jgi:hypothetical protein
MLPSALCLFENGELRPGSVCYCYSCLQFIELKVKQSVESKFKKLKESKGQRAQIPGFHTKVVVFIGICIFLVMHDVKHVIVFIGHMYISSMEKCLFRSFAH